MLFAEHINTFDDDTRNSLCTCLLVFDLEVHHSLSGPWTSAVCIFVVRSFFCWHVQVAKTFREKCIPCDVIWIDIDYMDGFRCFTFDQVCCSFHQSICSKVIVWLFPDFLFGVCPLELAGCLPPSCAIKKEGAEPRTFPHFDICYNLSRLLVVVSIRRHWLLCYYDVSVLVILSAACCNPHEEFI